MDLDWFSKVKLDVRLLPESTVELLTLQQWYNVYAEWLCALCPRLTAQYLSIAFKVHAHWLCCGQELDMLYLVEWWIIACSHFLVHFQEIVSDVHVTKSHLLCLKKSTTILSLLEMTSVVLSVRFFFKMYCNLAIIL